MKKIWMLPFTLLSFLFGSINWSAPPWLKALNKLRQNRAAAFYGIFGCIILLFGAIQYYQSLPQPITVKAELGPIGFTPNRENAKPNNLNIHFVYDLSRLKEGQTHPQGNPSIARIDLLGKEFNQGISLSPAKKGHWEWTGDRQLRFVPQSDWSAGTQYTVEFEPSIFVKEAKLSEMSYQFSTPEFSSSIDSLEFYQDPLDITVRRVISTINFSHSVDKDSFEESVSMSMRPSGSDIDKPAKPFPFEINYDKNLREAYIQSQPVLLPNEPNYMKLSVDAGVKTIFGGAASLKKTDKKVLIPDIYSFLKVNSAQTQIVRNEKNEPEQVLMLEFTDDIERKELLSKLQVYLLPKKGETNGRKNWRGPREVNSLLLADLSKLDINMIANEKEFSKFYSFVFDVPENRSLYVKIEPGLTSVNHFVHAQFYDSLVRSPGYPKEVKIAGQGSLLTYSGDHKLSILSRGVATLKYSVGRLLEGQLYHLMTQTRGDINNPNFSSWTFAPENIAEFNHEIVDMVEQHPKLSNYSSVDLSRFLPKDKNRFGLFFVNVKGWDKKNKNRLYGVEDRRLVLITDLGLIVKNNADKTHDVFVQSIKTGEPVKGATVELLGKNGIALYARMTSSQGHVEFPSTRDFKDEKEPVVYVVKTSEDISFIPFDRYSRQMNLSKFDIGGVSVGFGNEALNAFLFSDRGIYRPGEKVNVGAVVKNYDFSNVENIPLELVVRGPRNNEVRVKRISLAELGFIDFQYQTESTSDTGRYSVSLHLVRNNRHRGREIGSIDFKVEEFQPDTMKIESKLVDIADQGWSDKKNIQAKVSLQNLFGVPAQNRDLSARVIIKPTNFSFKQYKDYQFSTPFFDSNNKALHLDRKLSKQQTDADGLAVFDIDLQQFSQGAYQLHFIAEGFEPGGGRSVVSSNTALISPLGDLVGYKTDGKLDYVHAKSKRNIEFIAIDKTLKKQNKSNLTLRLLQIQHVSTLVKQYNGTYKYQTIKKESELNSEPLEISKQGYLHAIDTNEPGDYAVEIIEQGRKLLRVEYSIVGHGNIAGMLDKNAELQLKLNKQDYVPGEMIEMNIKAPYRGAGLITIETDSVQHFKWFKTDSQSSVQSIKLPLALEGTGYVNVAFVRDLSSKEIFTSPLSYAVKPFSIDKSKRKIDVTLNVKDIVRPGKPMAINYSASKNSKIAIFAVDEGILQVARYSTPDPLNHFLKKRALGVQTLQILDLILPEFELLKALSASGGDMAARNRALAKNLNPFTRKTDKPAVYWSGIQSAGPETQTVSFNVPDTFAGSLRVMAVAVSESAVGAVHQSTLVRGPFVISPKVLTQVAPGDEFMVTAGVANLVQGSGKDAEVNISVSASDHLTILGQSSAKTKIAEGGEGQFSFRVKANKVLGAAELKFIVNYKNEESKRTAGLSVRPAMPYRSSFESGFAQSSSMELLNKRQLYQNLAVQTVSASASPLVLVNGLTSYLDSYPHGCTEQVVSKVFPLVGLMNHPFYATHLKKVDLHFSHLIDKLRERQLADGGFAFWPGQQSVAEYPSIYVMHFLIEASSLGYPVPSDMLNRGKYYLTDYAARDTNSLAQARNRANAIYLLSRLGVVTTNYLVDLEEQLNKAALEKKQIKPWREDLLAAYMAATYKLLQKDAQAEELIAEYQFGGADFSLINGNNQMQGEIDDFHSALTQDAQYIYLISKHFETRAKALSGENLLELTSRIFKGEYNTISSAYSILALGAYSKLALNGQFEENITFSSWVKDADKKLLQKALQPFSSASYPVNIDGLAIEGVKIKGDKPLYYLNTQSGFDKQAPNEVVREGIEIHRDFLDDKGTEVTTFEQGQEMTVRLRVRALGKNQLTNVAVIDLLPGGFEVIRSSVSRTAYGWKADYVDIREDRVVYYGDFDASIRELTYKVKLTAAGTFVIPPSYAESMYDRSIRAISKAGTFVVTDQHSLVTAHDSVSSRD